MNDLIALIRCCRNAHLLMAAQTMLRLNIRIISEQTAPIPVQAELNQAKTTIQPAPKSQQIVASKKAAQESVLARQARELEAYTSPPSASQQKELTNQEIGWFD